MGLSPLTIRLPLPVWLTPWLWLLTMPCQVSLTEAQEVRNLPKTTTSQPTVSGSKPGSELTNASAIPVAVNAHHERVVSYSAPMAPALVEPPPAPQIPDSFRYRQVVSPDPSASSPLTRNSAPRNRIAQGYNLQPGRTSEVRRTRHPLALEAEETNGQPHPFPKPALGRSQPTGSYHSESAAPWQTTAEFVSNDSHDLDLVRAPIAENRLNPAYTEFNPVAGTREQFWRQFATLPPDDPKARTEGYDSLQAILNNGFWFAGVDVLYLEPMFQENHAFLQSGSGTSSVDPVDFGFDVSFRGHLGFQTNAGPAIKLSYWRFDEFSSLNQFYFDGTGSAVTFIDLGDSDNQIQLGNGANTGSLLTVRQQLKINSTEVLIYKDQKNPVSRVRGNVGLRHVSLQQKLFAGLDDPLAGSTVVRNFNDYFGAGIKLGIEYFRPVGHTDLELQSGMFGSLLFGRRDQIFDQSGPTPFHFEQIGKVEPLTIFEMYLGVQWNIKVSKCRHIFFRSAVESQLWAGSDTALDIGSDMGLYGMTFGFGLTQ